MNFASVFSPSRALPCLLAAALTVPAIDVRAQAPGTVDTIFKMAPGITTTYAVVRQDQPNADGALTLPRRQIFAGGDSGYEEITNPDGSIKGNFVQPTFGNIARIIYTAVPEQFVGPGSSYNLPKLVLGGLFGQSATQAAAKVPGQNITRILPDGSQDASFNVGSGANGYVTSILTLPHGQGGQIVVGGLFTMFNQQAHQRLVRLNNDGSVDGNFAKGLTIDGDVQTLATGLVPNTGLPDNTTLVAGNFNHVAGQAITKLARLDANGNLDPTFKPVIDLRVLAIHVQRTGKIIIGGEFTSVNGHAVQHIARLNYDGSFDPTFTATVTGLPSGESNPVAVYVFQSFPSALDAKGHPLDDSGRIYMGGNFTQINGATRRFLGVLNPDGSVGAFDPGTTIYDKVQSIWVQLDGRVLVGHTLGPKIGKSYQPSLIRLFGAPLHASQ